MRSSLLYSGILLVVAALPACGQGQDASMDLDRLTDEALRANPEIRAAALDMDGADAKARQAGTLDPPEFRFMNEGMPSWRWIDAMFRRYELMQMIPFPGKRAAQEETARIVSDHAHHTHRETMFEITSAVQSAYAELWFAQRSAALARESAGLLRGVLALATTRYGVGKGGQQEPLRAALALDRIESQEFAARHKEAGAKAMLQALLNRPPADTLGEAILPDSIAFTASLDTLLAVAGTHRAMVAHDSLMIAEQEAMQTAAHREYLPDFRVGVEYMTAPAAEMPMRAWSVSIGLTLPFAPWAIGRTSAMVEEAAIGVERAQARYIATRNMVRSTVTEAWTRAVAAAERVERLRRSSIPMARQALNATLIAYQTDKADLTAVLDASRAVIDYSLEHAMARMEFEQAQAQLDRAVGVRHCAQISSERN